MSKNYIRINSEEYDDIGLKFQRLTAYPGPGGPSKMSQGQPWAGAQKIHHEREEIMGLPKPQLGDFSFWEVLVNRQSHRDFSDKSLLLEDLSTLLFAAAGLKEKVGKLELHVKTVPSAGALHPIETYLFCLNVQGLKPGIYHFLPQGHQLERLRSYDRDELARLLISSCNGQKMTGHAPVTFAWTTLIERCSWKYSERAWRYSYLDGGHCCQNLYLAASALGLGCCAIASFLDEELAVLLGVDKDLEPPIYLGTLGHKK